ncbi:MAG TPA: hypothetical protein VFK09_05965, partial [Gemmatimonadales bacterium]|nr:hypothetical protein [Gemmatimonadales bacterium]
MGLASLLPSLRGLDDLPGLVAELGHEPAWEPGPERDWAGARGPVALVGRAGALPWFATEAARPARAARALARNLACRGRAAAVMALSPGDRVIALAVAFGDSPCLALSLDAPDRAALACLDRLRGLVEGGALGKAAQVADALAGEPAGRRFFRQFRAVLERMSAALPPACPAEDRHSLALLQLTRVLFLYLVQSKGWLDGRADFMAQQVDRCLAHGRSLHRHLLHPLFFGTLNRPPGERTHAPRGFGRIPFLNGGLFEPHPLERRWPATLPTPLWRDA